MPAHDPILSLVRQVQRRLTLNRRLASSSQAGLAGLAGSLGLALGARLVEAPDSWLLIAWLPFLGTLLVGLSIHLGALPRVSLKAAALHIDAKLHLHDRITTHVSVPASSSPLMELVCAQATAALGRMGAAATPAALVKLTLPTTTLAMAMVSCLLALPLMVLSRQPHQAGRHGTTTGQITSDWSGASSSESDHHSPPETILTAAQPPPPPASVTDASPAARARHLLQTLQAGNIGLLEADTQAARLLRDLADTVGSSDEADLRQLMDALQSILERAGVFREPGVSAQGGTTGNTSNRDETASSPGAVTAADQRPGGDTRTEPQLQQGHAAPAPPRETTAFAATTATRPSAPTPRLVKVIRIYFQEDHRE